ncbi:hypothetical protein LS684_05110 [Cytobacillus spongiae]|uniref:hypothetical protein n=1 Tax=Cytobacillus spongiae TaxID=2901381 RepID=UPI001F36F7DC|nr:hypothetical protein [Cytobacillus spongiae]UII56823.1 hypothetical protein LS684_05110 [Cytobacillus spongiae]
MKKNILVVSALALGVLFTGTGLKDVYAAEDKPKDSMAEKREWKEKLVNAEKVKELEEKGYTKKEIFKGAHLAKRAEKSVDEVLAYYKENNSSWVDTANHYNVELNHLGKKKKKLAFVEENMDEILLKLAEYTNTNQEELSNYLNDDMKLKELMVAAVLSTLSNSDLDEILKLHNEGTTFKEQMSEQGIDHTQFHEEMKKLREEIKTDITN